ncbi:MAG: serine/threonine-protein kinase [Kiritimatiellae bacterium]|nr:serine/threonine-protein kinase [Kiritimatiellia bacterium]
MAAEEKNQVVLRMVDKKPQVLTAVTDADRTGIDFVSVVEAVCPHCNRTVSVADAKPLSYIACRICKKRMMVPGRLDGFTLYAQIGTGGMGAIYRTKDEMLGRDVAIKLVRRQGGDDQEYRDLLKREASSAGKINHPRVAQVYALNFYDGHPYLVMELVSGEDFASMSEREGKLDERLVLRMALDVAEGLTAINREGLVHGDIKPGNIVLDRDGNAKLVDFGLSGIMRRIEKGKLVGTPNYIAPELLRGCQDTHRSDIYSLGATLYYLLAGRIPFSGETPQEVIKARLYEKPMPLGKANRNISVFTQKLVMRMLETDPMQRPADSQVVAAEIRKALSDLNAERGRRRSGGLANLFKNPFSRFKLGQAESYPRTKNSMSLICVLGLLALLALILALRERSFIQIHEFLREEFRARRKKVVPAGPELAAVRVEPDPEVAETFFPPEDIFAVERKLVWQSVNLGDHILGGSTMQMGRLMVVQGSGRGMWEGFDSFRYVWSEAEGDYAFYARVEAFAAADEFSVSGLMIRGEDADSGPALLFGYLGNGRLFMQARHPDSLTDLPPRLLRRFSTARPSNLVSLIEISEKPLPVPSHLRLIRSGQSYEASHSADCRQWRRFAVCKIDLGAKNTVGLVVSAQAPHELATAKFSNVRLMSQGE